MQVSEATLEDLVDAVVLNPLDPQLRSQFREMFFLRFADIYPDDIQTSRVLRASLPGLKGVHNV